MFSRPSRLAALRFALERFYGEMSVAVTDVPSKSPPEKSPLRSDIAPSSRVPGERESISDQILDGLGSSTPPRMSAGGPLQQRQRVGSQDRDDEKEVAWPLNWLNADGGLRAFVSASMSA